MATEDTKKELREQFKSLVIIPFDKEKLDKSLDKYIKEHYPYEEGEFFETRQPMAYIRGSKVVINHECIGERIGKETIPIEIYAERREDGKIIETDVFPRYTFVYSIVDLISDFGLPETDIETFMGSRFAYNDRIVRNMKLVLKETSILATC
jgi:hypothetical protein